MTWVQTGFVRCRPWTLSPNCSSMKALKTHVGTGLARSARLSAMSESLLTTETVRHEPAHATALNLHDRAQPSRRRHEATPHGGGPGGPVRVPGATYRFQFNHLFTFKDALRARPVPGRSRHHRPVRLAVPEGRPGQPARLRRLEPQRDQPGHRQRGRLRGACRRPPRARHEPAARRGAEPHGRRIQPERRGGTTSWRTARSRPTRRTSTSTGRRSSRSFATRCCCRSSATSTGASWRTASCKSRSETAPSSSSTTSTSCRSRRPRTPTILSGPCDRLAHVRPADDDGLVELQSILTAISHLPTHERALARGDRRAQPREGGRQAPPQRAGARRPRDPGRGRARGRAAERAGRRLAQLRRARHAPERPGVPAGLLAGGIRGDQLPPLLRHQHAGGAPDRESRRLRRHPPPDLQLSCANEQAHGLRIDHPDGLLDPAGYFRRLQTEYHVQRTQADDRSPTTSPGQRPSLPAPNTQHP